MSRDSQSSLTLGLMKTMKSGDVFIYDGSPESATSKAYKLGVKITTEKVIILSNLKSEIKAEPYIKITIV